MKFLLVSIYIACLLIYLNPASVEANTVRHIYNHSSCDIQFGATTEDGHMYCNGGKDYFKVHAGSTAEYEVTTTRGVSTGTFYAYSGSSQERATDVEYYFTRSGSRCSQKTVSVYLKDCYKLLLFQKHTPTCGDLTIFNADE